ncbi:hypothetical protein D9758_007978 [Tetrapyrgos nigripes]|uniref:Uncharacterized protein n=1 Tax=Tetrapyrgos nigripes TaxID=182062 RepID=A0A8H5D0H9_9AGAR|nr:hypothetical protein D9758_007978 [Tetrapyrgos nigripes]
MSLRRTYSRKRKQEEPEEDSAKRQRLDSTPSPSPRKLVRDLSQIFDEATSSISAPSTPTKLARRMLGRSKTESAIDKSPSSDQLLQATSSLPSLPASPSKPKSPPPPQLSQEPKPLTRTVSNKRTYAGKSRTFLVSLPIDGNLASLEQSIQEEEDDFLNRESYSSLRTRWGVDNSEDDPFHDLGVSPPKSKVISPGLRQGKAKAKLA